MPIIETCTHPRCFNPRPCPTHHATKDTKTQDERQFYGSQRWRETSERQRRQEPLCRECAKQGRVTTGTMTDHIIPIRQGGERWNPANHQTLCDPCHQRKRRRER